MKNFKIKNGHNLKIQGQPENEIFKVGNPSSIIFNPSALKNVKIKLLIKQGQEVAIGTPLFYDKKNEKALYVSTCSGIVSSIAYGPRKVVDSIVIDNDNKNTRISADNKLSVDSLLSSGLFTYLRQKPFSKVPKYDTKPKSIFISAMPTEPFAVNYEYLIKEIDNYLQKGIDSLKEIYNCEIYLTSEVDSVFSNLSNVTHSTFNKLHPAGNVGIQIHNIDPIKDKNDTRWYLTIQDLNRIGKFYEMGEYENYKYVSVGGNACNKPRIYKYLIGTSISEILDKNNIDNTRIITGDILNGNEVDSANSIGYYDEVLSFIKTDNKRDFLGWLMPGLNKYSLTNAFLSKMISNSKSELSTKKNGSIRTIIPMGNWDKVMPMNIMTEYLIKNILIKDIDMMEKLGIYECSPEDFSLCSFACQSKVEVSSIIEEGLNLMEVEG